MIKKIIFVLAICISSPSFSYSSGFDAGHFSALMNSYHAALSGHGNSSDEMNGAMYLGFIAGIAASFNGQKFCIPREVQLANLANVTSEYVANHPSVIGAEGGDIVFKSLSYKYPCH
ncbi:MAG: Rap1a/Tai family immunity protein [Hafnia sp.]